MYSNFLLHILGSSCHALLLLCLASLLPDHARRRDGTCIYIKICNGSAVITFCTKFAFQYFEAGTKPLIL
ncbi:hypothetical protein BJV82DRAFT_603464 [Fennellomyces sp. T-0311]|nr:hypothetical protein BJV82DRAFT_603464 [Fennellomyces sp. T-0311]